MQGCQLRYGSLREAVHCEGCKDQRAPQHVAVSTCKTNEERQCIGKQQEAGAAYRDQVDETRRQKRFFSGSVQYNGKSDRHRYSEQHGARQPFHCNYLNAAHRQRFQKQLRPPAEFPHHQAVRENQCRENTEHPNHGAIGDQGASFILGNFRKAQQSEAACDPKHQQHPSVFPKLFEDQRRYHAATTRSVRANAKKMSSKESSCISAPSSHAVRSQSEASAR